MNQTAKLQKTAELLHETVERAEDLHRDVERTLDQTHETLRQAKRGRQTSTKRVEKSARQ